MIFFPENIMESDTGKSKNKYDDKYDLDEDQGTTIEPVSVDIDGVNDSMHDMYGNDAAEVAEWLEPKVVGVLKKFDIKKVEDIKKNVSFKVGRTEYRITADSKIRKYNDILRSIVEGTAYVLNKDYDTTSMEDIKRLAHVSYNKYINKSIYDAAFSFEESIVDNIIPNAKIHLGCIRTHYDDPYKKGNCVIMITNKNKNSKIRVKLGDDLNDVIKFINNGDVNMKQESFIQESLLNSENAKKDIDVLKENNRLENGYYAFITNSSKDLEHLYKTLFKRAQLDSVIEELDSIVSDLREKRDGYFEKLSNSELKRDTKYQGLKKIIDQDIDSIEKNIKLLKDPKYNKNKKALTKKTIKMINDLQQDMITECERSQSSVIRGIKDVTKKLWLFEYYTEGEDYDEDEIVTESTEDMVNAKIGEIMVRLHKQKELQDLAEKKGVQITGMRYTDDRIMDIATATVALILARNSGDPKYARLVDQGIQKRSLKNELINAYKDQANALINQYNTGSTPSKIVVTNPDIEVITDEDELHEEFYIDENGEMQSTLYQESDDVKSKYTDPENFGKHDENDLEWKVEPGKKVGKIKFGDTRNKTQAKIGEKFGVPKHTADDFDDYGYFKINYENNKVYSVTIQKNDISIELDRSIVFPGNTDNIKKKALDLTENNGNLVSKVMSLEVEPNSDGTIKTITFARAHYYADKDYEEFESVKSLMNRGMSEDNAIKYMKELYKFLDRHDLLTSNGEAERRNINSQAAINTNEIKSRGNEFLKAYYNKCNNCDHKSIKHQLEIYWDQFNNTSSQSSSDDDK